MPYAVTTEMTKTANSNGFQLPGGPYIRVEAIGANLNVLGNTLKGDYVFERYNDKDGKEVNILAANNVEVEVLIGSEKAEFTDGQGAFVLKDSGVAGYLSGLVDISVGPVDAGGRVGLSINDTAGAVSESITLNGNDVNIEFQTSNVFEVSVSDLSLNIGDFVWISGDVFSNDYLINVTNSSGSNQSVSG